MAFFLQLLADERKMLWAVDSGTIELFVLNLGLNAVSSQRGVSDDGNGEGEWRWLGE